MDTVPSTAAELTAAIRSGTLGRERITRAYLDRIDERDDQIRAFITVTRALAETSASRRDSRRSGQDGQLEGVPVALKDLRCMKQGVRHTFGSAVIDEMHYVAPKSSMVVERLEDAGAVIVGKTSTPEFGHKGITNNAIVGSTASPIDPSMNAGGSSGGSAAAVAAGMAAIGLGSDSGGSIRIPASCCGVVGLKPSPGLVPIVSQVNAFRNGIVQGATGPLTRTVDDAARVMDVIAGQHPRDPESVPVQVPYRDAVGRDVGDLRVAYSENFDVFPVERAVSKQVQKGVDALASAGAAVTDVEIGHGRSLETLTEAGQITFEAVMLEGIVGLEHALEVNIRAERERLDDSLVEILDRASARDVTAVARTGPDRTAVFNALAELFTAYDLLALPTLARPGVPVDSKEAVDWEFALTWPFNWTGHPSISVPAGCTSSGRPVGLQFVGPRYGDDTVLAAAAAIERTRPWSAQYPD